MKVVVQGKQPPINFWEVNLWVCKTCESEVQFFASDKDVIQIGQKFSKKVIMTECPVCRERREFMETKKPVGFYQSNKVAWDQSF